MNITTWFLHSQHYVLGNQLFYFLQNCDKVRLKFVLFTIGTQCYFSKCLSLFSSYREKPKTNRLVNKSLHLFINVRNLAVENNRPIHNLFLYEVSSKKTACGFIVCVSVNCFLLVIKDDFITIFYVQHMD